MRKIIHKYLPQRMVQALPFWGAAILVAGVAVGYAHVFQLVEKFSQWLFSAYPFYMLILTPLCFLLAWWVVKLAPEAKGSGLPQVMVAVDASHHKRSILLHRLLGLPVAGVKILSSLICVLGGGAVGREGPTAQVAASLFYEIGTQFQKLGLKKISQEIWIVTGSAAGIAAAFNTPLGGIVFAIEELSQTSFHRLKLMLIAGVIMAGLTAQWLGGPYLYLGYPSLQPITAISLVWVVVIGGLCGLLGSFFAKLLYFMLGQVSKINAKLFPFFVIFLGVLIALIGIYVGPYALGAGREVLIGLLFKDVSLDWKIAVARFFTPLLTYLSGVSGGVFAPALSVGGCVGFLFATLFHIPYVHLFIMLGMIGFLTGVTRAPFTSFVLVLEMTDRHEVIFPMMLVALVASFTAKLVEHRSLYSKIKRDYWATSTQ